MKNKKTIYILPLFMENNSLVLSRLGKVFKIKGSMLDILKSMIHGEDLIFTYSLPCIDIYMDYCNNHDISDIHNYSVKSISNNGLVYTLLDIDYHLEPKKIKESLDFEYRKFIMVEQELSSNKINLLDKLDIKNTNNIEDHIISEVAVSYYDNLIPNVSDIIEEDNKIIDLYDLITKKIVISESYIGNIYRVDYKDDNNIISYDDESKLLKLKDKFRNVKIKDVDTNNISEILLKDFNIENYSFYTTYGYKITLFRKDDDISIKITNLINDSYKF